MKKVLITGASGLLGKGMEETSPEGYLVVGTRLRNLGRGRTLLDVRDAGSVRRLFEEHRFDVVVHAAGISDVDRVERHYEESLETNVAGTTNVLSASVESGAHLIYVSTNAVFDGQSAPYGEDSPTDPVNRYGHLKVACERIIEGAGRGFTIVRPILMYGWNHPEGRKNPASWIHDRLSRGEPVELVDDVRENPLHNVACGRAVWEMVRRKTPGIVHVAGKDVVNRWEFGTALARAFGFDESLVRRVTSARFPLLAPRPANSSLATARMKRGPCPNPPAPRRPRR